MARQFQIPPFYRSRIVSGIKGARRAGDARKKDLSPSVLDLGAVRFKLARHFGFCFGVENAIEIAYRALAENASRRVFLLSEMIHNPRVNEDLQSRGVRFLMKPDGSVLVPFEELTGDDIVIVPAFGTTLQILEAIKARGIDPLRYDTTCPFVQKVWSRSEELGRRGFTVVIHGKAAHEETRATFSHARAHSKSVIVRDLEEAKLLAEFITGERSLEEFPALFAGRYSDGFSAADHLTRIGVVNQTTMLAEETQTIAEVLRDAMRTRYGAALLVEHYADTRDTLCYATTENQSAAHALVAAGGDLALVVGGYNSSNTSHLVELLEAQYPTYFIQDATEILDYRRIRHLKLKEKCVVETQGWLPQDKTPVTILVGAGASCPDKLIEEVLIRVSALFGVADALPPSAEELIRTFEQMAAPLQRI
jgi:4-hydroxy-3-methylbut-2-enyl diphosphate reductase